MRHYVLTRSAYGPEGSTEENARRLAVTRAVTAPLMAAQSHRDWTWIVLLDPRDPLLDERRALFASASPTFRPILWQPPTVGNRDQVAYMAYKAPWNEAIGPRNERILQVRLDDDDGLAPDALCRYIWHGRKILSRRILMLPRGVRVWDGRFDLVTHRVNAMHALITQPRQDLCVYDYKHTTCQKAAPVTTVDQDLGWLWVRHRDTISGWKQAARPITGGVRRAFPIDWRALAAAWA